MKVLQISSLLHLKGVRRDAFTDHEERPCVNYSFTHTWLRCVSTQFGNGATQKISLTFAWNFNLDLVIPSFIRLSKLHYVTGKAFWAKKTAEIAAELKGHAEAATSRKSFSPASNKRLTFGRVEINLAHFLDGAFTSLGMRSNSITNHNV